MEIGSFLLRQRLELFDLLDEIGFLVVELFVVLSVVVKLGQEVDQLVLVPEQDVKDRLRLVRVCDENLGEGIRLKEKCPPTIIRNVSKMFIFTPLKDTLSQRTLSYFERYGWFPV